MGNKTKIDWCDATWNPVTGCLHGCEYCYARRIAERFGGCWRLDLPPDTSWRRNIGDGNIGDGNLMGDYARHNDGKCHVLDTPEIECAVFDPPSGYRGKAKPYPYYFSPTFHRYKLDEPQHWKKTRNIFVCSMADLFGYWVPDEWIEEVFKACEAAPWHRYLFLTKNPKRYSDLYDKGIMPKGVKAWNKYFGCTITKQTDEYFFNNLYGNGIDHPGFISIEPIMDDFVAGEIDKDENGIKWIIIGAETGNRKGKVIPKREWIEHIAETCRRSHIPVFMKESLRELMGDDFRQEFPWEVAE